MKFHCKDKIQSPPTKLGLAGGLTLTHPSTPPDKGRSPESATGEAQRGAVRPLTAYHRRLRQRPHPSGLFGFDFKISMEAIKAYSCHVLLRRDYFLLPCIHYSNANWHLSLWLLMVWNIPHHLILGWNGVEYSTPFHWKVDIQANCY